MRFDEEEDVDWTADADCEEEDDGRSSQKSVLFDGKPVSEEKVQLKTILRMSTSTRTSFLQIQKAIAFYRETRKGTRSLSCMMSKFTWIKSQSHLNRLRHIEQRGVHFRTFLHRSDIRKLF